MALLLRVLVLGVIAAAAHDNVTWSGSGRVWLGCAVPGRERVRARRPPPPLRDDAPRPRLYLWRKDHVEINPKRISSNGSLEVTRRREGDGTYQCGVRGQSGVVLGYPIHLKFATMEKEFWLSPENVTVSAGQPVGIPCLIRSDPPALVTWYRNQQPLPKSQRYYELQSRLLILDVNQEDEGVYHCTATNPILNKTRTSPGGSMVVRNDQELQPPAFLLDDYEEDIMRPQGSDVVLPCPVTGWPRPQLIWELSNAELGERKAELEWRGEVVTLRSLQDDQLGRYSCTVEGSPHLTRSFNVQMSAPPNITIPPTPKEAPRAITIRFNCTATGRPTPTITWYKDGLPLVLGGRINFRTSTDGKRNELVISGVTSEDAGVYQCFAETPAGVSSAWATLNVTGADAAAPTALRCRPEGPTQVRLSWRPPAAQQVVAYTVHTTPQDASTTSQPGLPHTNTEELVTVDQALAPYRFQVRAYMQTTSSNKNVASDMSEVVVCSGQGVPIKLTTLSEDSVLVWWKQFASQTPEVVQWQLQYRRDNHTNYYNVTLDAAVNNYTLSATKSSPLLVRVLGTRSLPWLQQDLSMVPWTSTSSAGDDLDDGVLTITPHDVEASAVNPRGFTVTWRCEYPDVDLEKYTFLVCAKKVDSQEEECRESSKTSVTFDNLEASSEYVVRVRAVRGRAVGGPPSQPLIVLTHSQGPQRFRNLLGQFVNSSAIRVSWDGAPASYTVHYSAQLKLPVEQWDSVQTNGNTVLITGIDPTEKTYVMVTDNESQDHSKIETIPPLYKDPEAMDLQYEYTGSGVRVWWAGEGEGRWSVRYAQNITRPVETWNLRQVQLPTVELTDLDPALPVYVMVTVSEKRSKNQVLTIEPRPQASFAWHYVIGIVAGVIALGVLAVGAVCVWRRRKRARSPLRARRRNVSVNEGNEEEGSELKGVGGRLANGGARGAGQPLLNGHLHITENPTVKTPNGKMRKGVRYENAFDVSRYEDADGTLETVLDADTSTSTACNLLDTSRRPDLDLSRSSREVSANNSFNKLPDDNMNSELTRSTFELDNSKIQPTLQPNG